jgi:hypothetical protein
MENNKLIAEFMGIKPTKGVSHKWHYSDSPYISINSDRYEEVVNAITDYAKYNSSWDWLMPVVEKMNNVPEWDEWSIGDLSICLVSASIVDTYNEVVRFIKWYNKQED